MNSNLHVFLDTSALFSAVYSAEGGARLLLKMGEVQIVTLFVGNRVLTEMDAVLLRKAPKSRALFAFLLNQARVQTGPKPTAEDFAKASAVVDYKPDIQVLAEALAAKASYMVSFDRKHLVNNPNAHLLPFKIGTAGDFLAWYREHYRD